VQQGFAATVSPIMSQRLLPSIPFLVSFNLSQFVSAVLPTIYFVWISILYSSCENIPALTGANFLFAGFYRPLSGAKPFSNRTAPGFHQFEN
jgi:hypothetical protein